MNNTSKPRDKQEEDNKENEYELNNEEGSEFKQDEEDNLPTPDMHSNN